MKVLTRQMQEQIYKRIVEVVTTLAANADTEENRYAISDMWHIAKIVGGREMVDALEGKNYHTRPLIDKIGNTLCDSIDAFDSITDCQWK